MIKYGPWKLKSNSLSPSSLTILGSASAFLIQDNPSRPYLSLLQLGIAVQCAPSEGSSDWHTFRA